MWTTGVQGFDPMEKYSKMTNKWRHASRKMHFLQPASLSFFCHFCDVRQKHKQWQKVINLQVAKNALSRGIVICLPFCCIFWHFGDMCEKNDKVLQMTNKYKSAGCKTTFFSRHCHFFAILLSCFVFFGHFWYFSIHTYIHTQTTWEKWQTKWHTKTQMTKTLTNKWQTKMTDQKWHDKKHDTKWQTKTEMTKTMAKTTTNKWHTSTISRVWLQVSSNRTWRFSLPGKIMELTGDFPSNHVWLPQGNYQTIPIHKY